SFLAVSYEAAEDIEIHGLFEVWTNQRNPYLKLTKLVSRLFTKTKSRRVFYRIFRIIKELIRKTRALTDQERVHFKLSFGHMVLSDVRVHIGLICDNCQMYPLVGKRCTWKHCWEEHTCTERGVEQNKGGRKISTTPLAHSFSACVSFEERVHTV
ncbi:hypothetical protein FRX31_005608, partial [Thalictrum thalictroides]